MDTHIGNVSFLCVFPLDGANLSVIPLGDIADHAIGKITAFL